MAPKKILIITPAPPGSRKGNRITALRWAKILSSLGYRVRVLTEYAGEKGDLLIALHGLKSHSSLEGFRRSHPHLPRVVALTGTDLYGDIHHSPQVLQSLEEAHYLILLQDHGLEALPGALRSKGRVIYQSVSKPAKVPLPSSRAFFV